jgi:hypothetical protein
VCERERQGEERKQRLFRNEISLSELFPKNKEKRGQIETTEATTSIR